MNESNKNFGELKKLLKLKRHEIPPPGCFNNFSSEVISRIRAGEARRTGSLAERLPRLAALLQIFQTKPGVIGGFATSLCLVLLIGVVMADRPMSVPSDVLVASSTAAPAAPDLASIAPSATASESVGIVVGTNSNVSFQPAAMLFGQQQNPLFQSASFSPALR